MKYKTSVKNWEGLAQYDALWSILTDGNKKGEKWNVQEFFNSGSKEIDAAFSALKENGIEVSKTTKAIDFGCGAGRLTRALCDRFDKVVGVDASNTMIDLARKGNKDKEDKISFALNQDGDLNFIPSGTVSFAMSFIVLQHIPYPQSLNFISEFVRILEPGGLAVFQVPTKDVRKLSTWQKFKSTVRVRERLALIGIGKGFQMDMHVLDKGEISKAVLGQGGVIERSLYTNQTLPDYNGALKVYSEETEACGYISEMIVVRKS